MDIVVITFHEDDFYCDQLSPAWLDTIWFAFYHFNRFYDNDLNIIKKHIFFIKVVVVCNKFEIKKICYGLCIFAISFTIKKNQGFKSIPISVVPHMHANEIFCPEVSNTGVLEKFAGTITFCVLLFSSMHILNPVSTITNVHLRSFCLKYKFKNISLIWIIVYFLTL